MAFQRLSVLLGISVCVCAFGTFLVLNTCGVSPQRFPFWHYFMVVHFLMHTVRGPLAWDVE